MNTDIAHQDTGQVEKPDTKAVQAALHFKRMFPDKFEEMHLSFTYHEFSITREDMFEKVLVPLGRTVLEEYPEPSTAEWTQLISEINTTRGVINSASIVGGVLPPFELIAKNSEIHVRDNIATMEATTKQALKKAISQLETSQKRAEKSLQYSRNNLHLLPPLARAAVLSKHDVQKFIFGTLEEILEKQYDRLEANHRDIVQIYEKEMKQLEHTE